jgi:hypothetical protein
MTYASPWFGILYAAATVAGVAAMILGVQLDRRVGGTLAVIVATVAGLVAGLALRGMQADVSGEPFALPTPPRAVAAIPDRLGAPSGPATQLSVELFSDAAHPGPPVPAMSISTSDSVMASGWAYDASAHTLCAAVVLVVDGRPFPAVYGSKRSDVAGLFGADHLETGFSVNVRAALLGAGRHRADVRCLNAAGAAFASPTLSFEVSR